MDLNEAAARITADILADYALGRDIDPGPSPPYPDRTAIAPLVRGLLGIIFPGSCGSRPSPEVIGDAMQKLQALLMPVLADREEPGTLVRTLSLSFFSQIPALRALIQTDVQAAFDGDPAAAGKDEIIFCYPGLLAVAVYRLAHALHRLEVPLIPRAMSEYVHSLTGIDIHPGARIADHFFIDHGTGVVIGETAVIGSHVTLYQGVTLGSLTTRDSRSLRGQKRHPTLGDNVTVYAGASVLGGQTVIGSGSVIGAHAFVTESVAPYTTVRNAASRLRPRPPAGF